MADVLVTAAVNNLRQSVERFDKSSADLVTATNKLTKRIYVLTWIFLFIGTIQTAFTILGYLRR